MITVDHQFNAQEVAKLLEIPRDKKFPAVPGSIEWYIPNNKYALMPNVLRQFMLEKQNELRAKFGYREADHVTGWIVEYNVGDGYPFHNDVRAGTSHDREGRDYLASVTLLSDPKSFKGGLLVFDDKVAVNFPAAGHIVLFDGEHQKHCVTKIKEGQRVAIVCWAS